MHFNEIVVALGSRVPTKTPMKPKDFWEFVLSVRPKPSDPLLYIRFLEAIPRASIWLTNDGRIRRCVSNLIPYYLDCAGGKLEMSLAKIAKRYLDRLQSVIKLSPGELRAGIVNDMMEKTKKQKTGFSTLTEEQYMKIVDIAQPREYFLERMRGEQRIIINEDSDSKSCVNMGSYQKDVVPHDQILRKVLKYWHINEIE